LFVNEDEAFPGYALEMDMVTTAYDAGAGRVIGLDRVTLGLRRGSVSVVIGPAAAGKSALAACVVARAEPTSGSIFRHDPPAELDWTDPAAVRSVLPRDRRLMVLDGLEEGAIGVVERLREVIGPLGPTVLITTRDARIAAAGDVALLLVGGRLVDAMSDMPAALIDERLGCYAQGVTARCEAMSDSMFHVEHLPPAPDTAVVDVHRAAPDSGSPCAW
jgi:ABC transporter family protein